MRFPNALHARCDSNSNSNEHSDGHEYHNLAIRIPSSCITTLLKSQETKDGDSNLACELVARRLYIIKKPALRLSQEMNYLKGLCTYDCSISK